MMSALSPYIVGVLGAAIIIALIHLAEKHLIREPFWQKPSQYPASHAVAKERVLRYVDLVAASPAMPDEQIEAALVQQGVPAIDAELLTLFVPMAFAWVTLKRMGVSSFPKMYVAFGKASLPESTGHPVEFALAHEHYFLAALDIGQDCYREKGDRVARPEFEAILFRSAEMSAANKALNQGAKVAGGTIAPPTVLSPSAEEIRAARAFE